MDARAEFLDAVGVLLAPGQRVVYATAGIHSTGQLVPGTIVSIRRIPGGLAAATRDLVLARILRGPGLFRPPASRAMPG